MSNILNRQKNSSYTTQFGPFGLDVLNWQKKKKQLEIAVADQLMKIPLINPQLKQDDSPDSSCSSSSLFLNLPQTSDCFCDDVNCELCIAAKLRVPSRMSKTHPQEQSQFSSSDTTPSSSSSKPGTSSLSSLSPSSSSSSASDFQNTCEIHSVDLKVFCQTCNVPICEECGNPYHKTHVTVSTTEGLEITSNESNNVLNEISLGLQAIDNDLQNITSAFASLDIKSKEAVEDLNRRWFLLKIALDERRKKLLTEIERANNEKRNVLKEREDGLKYWQRTLIDLVTKQQLAIKATTRTKNPVHLRAANGKAIGVTFEVQEARKVLMKLPEIWIGFSASEKSLVEAISDFGSVILNNPGPIGDRRIIKGRGLPNVICREHLPLPKMLSISQNPCGRPIASTVNHVVVWTEKPRYSSFYYPPHIKMIGKRIQEPEHPDNLCRPWGVACDKDNNIFVADRSNNRILVFREDGSIVRRIGTYGAGPQQFNRPAGITIDERGRLIVADKDNHRIEILTLTGSFLLEFGKKGSECGQFNYPWDVAANSACEIVVSDTRNHRIQLFSPEGTFLRKFGMDTNFGAFKFLDSPRGVAFTPEGNIILTDFNAHRILCVDYKFLSAKILNCEGGMRSMSNFHRPQGVIVDDDGNIVVSDSRGYRIMIFNKFGAFLNEFGKQGDNIDEMDRPSGIALLSDGRIVFVDFGNNRVVIR